jgi:hypothetical protein
MLYMFGLLLVLGGLATLAKKYELKKQGKNPRTWNDEALSAWGIDILKRK